MAYGLDTIADIALNGRPVASTRNFHRSYRWDVRGLLRDGANELTVTFTSPVRESDHMEQARGYYPHTEHHAFNQIRKPSYSFGWDWGIDVANAGIWREIGIDSWSGVRIASVRPLVDVTADGTGLLNVHVEIDAPAKDASCPRTIPIRSVRPCRCTPKSPASARICPSMASWPKAATRPC